MSDWKGPDPNPTEEMRPFWEGLRRNEFLLLCCDVCGAWRWPLAGCREHPNAPYLENLKWTQASGRGKVFAFTVQRAQHDPAFPTPYVYAAIELHEGPMMVSTVVNCRTDAVLIGMPVRVVFRPIGRRYTLPSFEPVPSAVAPDPRAGKKATTAGARRR
ncbi:MAG: Zn-ribbon domain-containing OB-fold protein [Armatimonadota bacterium]